MSVVGKVLNTIILLRLQGAVDATLKDRQAGFRKDHSCIDQLATLRIIIEQSIEWNTSLYVNFVGFEKAFDSLIEVSLVPYVTLWLTRKIHSNHQKYVR